MTKMLELYYVTDLLPDRSDLRSWTIHGAFSHRRHVWRALVEAGDEIYVVALRQSIFLSNDQGAWSNPAHMRVMADDMEEAYRRVNSTPPVPFDEVARWLRQRELEAFKNA